MNRHIEHLDRLKIQSRALAEKQQIAKEKKETSLQMAADKRHHDRRLEENKNAQKNREIIQKKEEARQKSETALAVAETKKQQEIDSIHEQGNIKFSLSEQSHRHRSLENEVNFQQDVALKNGEYNFLMSRDKQQIKGKLTETRIKEQGATKRTNIEQQGATTRTQIQEDTKRGIARLEVERDILVNDANIRGNQALQDSKHHQESYILAENQGQERYILAENQRHQLDTIKAETRAFLIKEKDKRKSHRKNAYIDMAVSTHQTNLNIYEKIIIMLAEKKIFGGRQNQQQADAVDEIVRDNIDRYEAELNDYKK